MWTLVLLVVPLETPGHWTPSPGPALHFESHAVCHQAGWNLTGVLRDTRFLCLDRATGRIKTYAEPPEDT